MAARQEPFAPNVLAMGVGAFTQSTMRLLRENGARVQAYLTRSYAHHGPGLEGRCVDSVQVPDPVPLIQAEGIDLIVPMSIEWALQPWTDRLLQARVPILCPAGEALKLERDREFA